MTIKNVCSQRLSRSSNASVWQERENCGWQAPSTNDPDSFWFCTTAPRKCLTGKIGSRKQALKIQE